MKLDLINKENQVLRIFNKYAIVLLYKNVKMDRAQKII